MNTENASKGVDGLPETDTEFDRLKAQKDEILSREAKAANTKADDELIKLKLENESLRYRLNRATEALRQSEEALRRALQDIRIGREIAEDPNRR